MENSPFFNSCPAQLLQMVCSISFVNTMGMLLSKIMQLPEGYSLGYYRGVKYGITKRTFNGGRSFKVFAEALGGRDLISLNLYLTAGGEHLKPCEMPPEKVIDFLNQVKPHSL